jgi:hypothetical protein
VSCSTSGTEPQRRCGGKIAKAYVGQKRPLWKIDAKDHVKHGARRIDIEPTHHARLQTRDAVPERSEGATKEHVLLEAIAAPSAGNYHFLQRPQIQFGRPIQ